MAGKKNNQKESRWRDVVHRQADSGLSLREFCTKEGISQPSFYAWRRKLGERKGSTSRPRSLSHGVDESGNGRDFVPLTVFDAAAILEVVVSTRLSGELRLIHWPAHLLRLRSHHHHLTPASVGREVKSLFVILYRGD